MQVNGGGRYGVSEAMVSQFVMQAAGGVGVGVGVGIGGARGVSHITSSPVLFSHHDSFQEEPNMVSHEEQQQQQQRQQTGLVFGLPVGSNDRQPGASKDANEDTSEDASEDGEDDEEGRGVAKTGMGGNRWPRDQTLALLKIRADMDSTFREAPAKTPLWEDISRKLGELGYHRSAKKCKEKFENVHKYYKRTKEGRTGRQDGKNYRFFTQLEALYSKTNLNSNANPTNNTNTNTNTNININTDTNTNTNTDIDANIRMKNAVAMDSSHDNPPQQEATWGKSSNSFYDSRTAFGAPKTSTSSLGERFVSSTSRILSSPLDLSSSSATEDDYNNEKQEKKRKRRSRSKSSKKMAHFFELVMKKLIRKQEKLQMKFLHALDRREKERLIREEAWKMQEMARLERELELKSQESVMAASRDAALTAFLQSFPHALTSGVVDPITTTATTTTTTNTTTTTSSDVIIHAPPSAMIPPPSNDEAKLHSLVYNSTSNKRWPKAEVLALIQLRTNMECRFQEPGPKGRIWKEISMNMSALGFNRSPNRCKEKWENINKYFKKNKDSSKKRSENSKTCPYFFQLDALYRKGLLGSSSRIKLLTNQSQEVEEEPSRSEEGGSNNNDEDIIAIKSVQEEVNIATKAAIGFNIQTNNSEDAIQTPVKEALPTNMKSKERQTNAEAIQLAEDL